MNLFLKKAAAFIAAGLMATASLGAECYAESGALSRGRVELDLAATVAKPTYTVKGSLGVRKVRLSTTTAGATIYYTTNGSVPTTSSKQYTGTLIGLKSNTKIKAIAVKDGVKSAVMTKTFYIATKYGDVTGDGQINQNDYSRLKNYIAGKTKYICKDNADCDGSGGLSSRDLTALSYYLNGTVSTLPSKVASTSVKKPKASYKKIYGGYQVTLAPQTSGSSVYYTTDGSTPTTSSKFYNGPFDVSESCTVKTMAELNGNASGVLSFNLSVGSLSPVQADKATTTTYSGETSITLYNSNSAARILYTTDGTDPRTSASASVYSSPVKINKDTTIRAYALAKGYADSSVTDFQYKVASSFSISGRVWDDTPGTVVNSNGVNTDDKPGIANITVYLINHTTSSKDVTTNYVQKTVTDVNGKYSFNNLVKGNYYKVAFEYNSQKYRAYNAIVANGNQATPVSTTNPFTVKASGAYDKVYTSVAATTPIANYATASTNAYFNQLAITSYTFSETSNAVGLALITKNYGQLALTLDCSGYDATTKRIENNGELSFKLTLTNNSPMAVTNLTDIEIDLYLPNMLSIHTSNTTGFVGIACHGTDEKAYPGYIKYIITGLSNTGLAPGKSASITFTGNVYERESSTINAIAQVTLYSYSTPCYDYSCTPGNYTIGSTRVLERDEAVTTLLTVVSSSILTQELTAVVERTTVSLGGTTKDLLIVAKNCKSLDAITFIEMTNQGIATYEKEPIQKGDDLYIYLKVSGKAVGTTLIPVKYGYDTKYLTVVVQ